MSGAVQLNISVYPDVLQFVSTACSLFHDIVNPGTNLKVGTVSFEPTDLEPSVGLSLFQNNLKRTRETKLNFENPAAKKPRNVPKPAVAIKPNPIQQPFKQPSNSSDIPLPKIDTSSMVQVLQNFGSDEKSYRCSFCGFESKHMVSTRRHIETKHLPSAAEFKCLTCDYATKHKHALKKHYMTTHKMPELAAKGMLMSC